MAKIRSMLHKPTYVKEGRSNRPGYYDRKLNKIETSNIIDEFDLGGEENGECIYGDEYEDALIELAEMLDIKEPTDSQLMRIEYLQRILEKRPSSSPF